MVMPDFSVLTKKEPEKGLTAFVHRNNGRSHGRITVRHKGGGEKRLYRFIDFKQNKIGTTLTIASLEYDPNRSAYIALAMDENGVKSYILAWEGLKVGDIVKISDKAELKKGNRMPLGSMPVGTFVYNIELNPGRGGQMARSAGATAKILAHEGGKTLLALPSSEMRNVPSGSLATIGEASNATHREEVIGKAGRSRHMGKRPHVRGSAMNPVDHPHGGGEGRAPIGLKYPKTPWGKHALGVKTRKANLPSNKSIIRRRKSKNKTK